MPNAKLASCSGRLRRFRVRIMAHLQDSGQLGVAVWHVDLPAASIDECRDHLCVTMEGCSPSDGMRVRHLRCTIQSRPQLPPCLPTLASAESDRLIFLDSSSRSPISPMAAAFSLPARSTKLSRESLSAPAPSAASTRLSMLLEVDFVGELC